MKVPAVVRHEHQELHADLDAATRAGGRTGEAARAVARIMQPHFVREDEYAMPPLSLLQQLAADHVTPAMADVLPLVARLEAELPLMLQEHRAIRVAIDELRWAAADEGHSENAELAQRLGQHALTEEEILYPAAILVGRYVKLKLGLSDEESVGETSDRFVV